MWVQENHNIDREDSQYTVSLRSYQWKGNRFQWDKGIKLGILYLKDSKSLQRKKLEV